MLVVALGIAESGEKHVLGVWQGATENTTVVKGLLEDLVDRGLDLKQRYLVVMDGSKALRAGVERVFGDQVEVQRCQIHKRRNVKEYLPENCQKDYDRRMRNAYAMNNYAEAKEALQKIFRQLERINPSAARSLEEGLEGTLRSPEAREITIKTSIPACSAACLPRSRTNALASVWGSPRGRQGPRIRSARPHLRGALGRRV